MPVWAMRGRGLQTEHDATEDVAGEGLLSTAPRKFMLRWTMRRPAGKARYCRRTGGTTEGAQRSRRGWIGGQMGTTCRRIFSSLPLLWMSRSTFSRKRAALSAGRLRSGDHQRSAILRARVRIRLRTSFSASANGQHDRTRPRLVRNLFRSIGQWTKGVEDTPSRQSHRGSLPIHHSDRKRGW